MTMKISRTMVRQISSYIDPLDSTSINLTSEDLEEVPLDEIVKYPQVIYVDLSINNIQTLSLDFAPRLSNIVHLDLSKNCLEKLPANFGELVSLQHLDLYCNKIQGLPVSMAKMTNLVWLDMKDNPINSCLKEVVGEFWNADECRAAAKNIVFFMSQVKMYIKNVKNFEYQNIYSFTLKTNPFATLKSNPSAYDLKEAFQTAVLQNENNGHVHSQNVDKCEPKDKEWSVKRLLGVITVWMLTLLICAIFFTVVFFGPGTMKASFAKLGPPSLIDKFILRSHSYIQSSLKSIAPGFPLFEDIVDVPVENSNWFLIFFHFIGINV